MSKPTVDAIICYHNHHDYLARCVESLQTGVRQVLVVNDGSDRPLPIFDGAYTELRRSTRHSPANSFNYGAFHSNADWLLYVDPHTIFFPNAVKKMLDVAGDEYDFVLGRGWVSFLDPDSKWGKLLAKSDLQTDVPLTFLIQRKLWDTLGGIPEPQYCHMDVLAQTLFEKGIVIAQLNKMCHHHIQGSMRDVIWYYWRAGFSYARAGVENPVVDMAKEYTDEHLAQLLSALFSSAYNIGAMEGLGNLPSEPLDATKFMLKWGKEA